MKSYQMFSTLNKFYLLCIRNIKNRNKAPLRKIDWTQMTQIAQMEYSRETELYKF